MPSWAVAALSVGALMLLIAALVQLRVRSEGRLAIETREIFAAIVIVGLGLFIAGEFDEIAYGEFRLVRSIKSAATAPVQDRVRDRQTALEFERITSVGKRGVDRIDTMIRSRSSALSFELGRKGYYVPAAIREYILRLTDAPYLKYLVFYDQQGRMFGLADARAIGSYFRSADRSLTPAALTRWISDGDTERVKQLPGFVEPVKATASTRDALSTMLKYNADNVPVTDDNGKFVGVASGTQLMGTILNALASTDTK